MKRFVLKVICFFFSIVMWFCLLIMIVVKLIPPQFNDLYQSEIVNKIKRISSINNKKIIYASGSSGAFCVDSKKISDELGIEFVNLGLHASFGQYFTNEIAKDFLNKNDILVISHEFDTYYGDGGQSGGISLLATSINDHFEYLKYFKSNDKIEFIKYLPAYLFTKLDKYIYKKIDTGIYSTESFNEYGDVKLELEEKTDNKYYHDIKSYDGNFSSELISYYHNLISYAEKNDASIILNYPYMRVRKEDIDYTHIEELDNELTSKLNLKSLYPLKEAIKEDKYFYDTANHCTSYGKKEYTNNLIKYLKKYVRENNL